MSKIRKLISQHKSKILALSKKYGMLNPRIFGSVLTNKEDPSDIDILVKAEHGRSFFDLVRFADALEELLNFKVDIVTEEGLSPYLEAYILNSAQEL